MMSWRGPDLRAVKVFPFLFLLHYQSPPFMLLLLQFIPVSFFKYLKGLECHEITLRSSGGKLWPIKLNGRQFTDGWKEFVRDQNLHIGDFVVFRHQGNLVFDFIVFNESTCEREYPSPFPSEEEETENEEETKIQQENVPIFRTQQIIEEETESPPFIPANEENEIQHENVLICTRSGKKVGRKKKGETSLCEPEHLYPNYVIKLSRDSFNYGRLNFPREFARENGLDSQSWSIILKDEESRCWKSKLLYSSVNKRLQIGAGWRDFRINHELKVGDSVMFELIKKGEVPVFRIHTLK